MTEPRHTMPGDGIPQALYDVVSLLEARVNQHFRGTGLHWGLRRILQQLWVRDSLSQAELAAAVRFSEASVSNMLKHLVKGEWVERRQDEYDYRISRVYVSERGIELKAAVERTLNVADAELREEMDPGNASKLRKLLDRALEILPSEHRPAEGDTLKGIWDHPSPPGEL